MYNLVNNMSLFYLLCPALAEPYCLPDGGHHAAGPVTRGHVDNKGGSNMWLHAEEMASCGDTWRKLDTKHVAPRGKS